MSRSMAFFRCAMAASSRPSSSSMYAISMCTWQRNRTMRLGGQTALHVPGRAVAGRPLAPGFPALPSALPSPRDPRRTKRRSLQTTGDPRARWCARAEEQRLGPAGLHATETGCDTKARWRAQQTRGTRHCISSSTPGGSWRGQASEFSTTEAQASPQGMGPLGPALSSLCLVGRSTHTPAQNASRGPEGPAWRLPLLEAPGLGGAADGRV